MTEKQAEGITAFEAHDHNMAAAARSLGITAPALRKRIKAAKPELLDRGCGGRLTEVAPADGGFNLDGRKLLAKRPTDVWKARFFALKPNTGYMIQHLADQWGNSADTVRSKARRFGALRYVEDADKPGNYVACIVHPDTPKGK